MLRVRELPVNRYANYEKEWIWPYYKHWLHALFDRSPGKDTLCYQ